MKQDSRYSRSFYSDGLTDRKYQEIHKLAVSICDAKNKISGIVNQDLFKYLEMSKHTFQQTLCDIAKEQKISNHFIWQLLGDAYTAYQNKFNNVKRRLKFQHVCSKNQFQRKDEGSDGKVALQLDLHLKQTILSKESNPEFIAIVDFGRF